MPQRLIEAGNARFGLFDQPVETINADDFVQRSSMDRLAPTLLRRFAYNQFQFVGVCSPELVLGCAVVDLKWVGSSFFYVYLPPSGELFEWSRLQPLARRTALALTPDRGCSVFSGRGLNVTIQAESDPRQRRLTATFGRDGRLDARLVEPAAFRPLALCTRAGYNGWVYTQKAAGLPVTGSLQFRGRDFDLGALAAHGNYDWTCGFMRRHTFWNWACCTGVLPDGRRFGLNLAAGVNETGFTENVFWLGDRFVKVDTVHFQFDRLQPTQPWTVSSYDGRVALRFEPEGLRREKLHVGFLASNFKQVFGRFYGTVHDADGQAAPIDGLYGFCEDHYAKW
ncbi:DUF2804 family protein [Acanthopleuribacter pedis]|uniref:DUF2804 domain-containing protein n=1 Tax=Acanthopleuribacter pedis TaxID=442870 RepID=A0A8J7Q7G1_9BACT|nr:DUF2804 domain-containing protein [Acanthopleuribacter pedis]